MPPSHQQPALKLLQKRRETLDKPIWKYRSMKSPSTLKFRRINATNRIR